MGGSAAHARHAIAYARLIAGSVRSVPRQVLTVNAGDGVIFRGDVWHAGCGYAMQHWRLHEYWQPEGTDDGLRADGDPPRVGWRRLNLWRRPHTRR